jgi:TPP-dependent pyruvate/acetoin dehydrogenase alpha subunit
MPEIENAKLKEIFALMLRIRAFEERVVIEYRKGNIPGFIHVSIGQEACAAGIGPFLREDDYVLTAHRGHGDIIVKGAKFDRMMAELFGKATGYCKGRGGSMHIAAPELNILGATAIVGAGIPIATGVALGCKMKGQDRVTVCHFGDAATCTGAFHEGVGMAAVWDLPVIFFCQNNFYGMSTPMKQYTKLENIADRAKAYGIPGVTVDGNDALAVAEVSIEAIERAREGRGPTLIEARTYRYTGHHLGDPGTSYRTKEEVAEKMKDDPIPRFQSYLMDKNLITEQEIEALKSDTARELDEAVKFALESPEPEIEEALTGMYAVN